VQEELIAGIHRAFMWPVVVTVDGNISKPNKRDFKPGDDFYILLTIGGNIKGLNVGIIGLFEGRDKFTYLWNIKPRFLVAGANEFSMSQQSDIFHFFSKHRIPNCIIVSQEHYVIDNGYNRPIIVN
jgi:hypothetical protein